MKTKTIISFVLFVLCLTAAAKDTFSNPQYVSWNAQGLSIRKVVTDDTATTLFFRCEGQPGARIWMDSECFLSDVQDRRYRVLSAKGIMLDSVFVYDRKGRGEFSISFEPLPEGTEVFDFVENLHQRTSFRFYMIHDRKVDAAWRGRLQNQKASSFSFPAEAFTSDSVIIRGRISGKGVGRKLQRLCLYNFVLQMGEYQYARRNSPKMTTVGEDGTFELKTCVAGPSWANLYLRGYGGDIIPVFLWPGDVIELNVENFGESTQTIRYRSRHEECNRLLNLGFDRDLFIGRDAVDELPEAQMVKARQRQLDDYMLLCRYFADKYHFTPTEQSLLESMFQMHVGRQLLYGLNGWASKSGVFKIEGEYDADDAARWRAYNTRPVYDFLASMPNTNAMFAVPQCNWFLSALYSSYLFHDCNRPSAQQLRDKRPLGPDDIDRQRAERLHHFRPAIPAGNDLLIQAYAYNRFHNTTYGDTLYEQQQVEHMMRQIHEPALLRIAQKHRADQLYYRRHPAIDLPQGRGKELLDSLIAGITTPYVHVYFYDPSDTVHRHNSMAVDTILAQRPHAEDMSFLILCPSRSGQGEVDYDNFRLSHLYPYVRCCRLETADLTELANLLQAEFYTQGFVLDAKRRLTQRVDMNSVGHFTLSVDDVKRAAAGAAEP